MKKFILNLLLVISVFSFVDVNALERNANNNYGVNKKWSVTSSNIDNIKRTPYVDASKKIYDYSDILTDDEESRLYTEMMKFINHTNMDMVIVTVDLPYSYDKTNEDYAADFYDYNDFGLDFTNYSGVLLLRNTYSVDPYFNVYMFGDAQLYFSYYRAEAMLDHIYPHFKGKRYFTGMSLFISDYYKYFDEGFEEESKDYYIDENGYLQKVKKFNPPFLLAFMLSTGITVIVMFSMVKRNKMIRKATQADDYLAKETVDLRVRDDTFVNSSTTSYRISSSSSGGGSGGFHSSGGSSGGGHSSGGGRHG